MGKRTWVKLYCENWVTGSLREETAELRGIWADLLALIGSNPSSDTGELKLMNGIGWDDTQIIKVLCISLDQWLIAKRQLIKTKRITVSKDNEIAILNWDKYQSDFDKQSITRKKKIITQFTETN